MRAPGRVFELGVPVLGICYGMQTMAAQLGGRVEASGKREFGHADLHPSGAGALLRGIRDESAPGESGLDVWMSHGDRVLEMPPGFRLMASTGNCPIAAIADDERRFYGVQFHPEVTHTPRGKEILDRFVHGICGCRAPVVGAEHHQKTRSPASRNESETRGCCSRSPGASILRWWRRCCIAPSAIG